MPFLTVIPLFSGCNQIIAEMIRFVNGAERYNVALLRHFFNRFLYRFSKEMPIKWALAKNNAIKNERHLCFIDRLFWGSRAIGQNWTLKICCPIAEFSGSVGIFTENASLKGNRTKIWCFKGYL